MCTAELLWGKVHPKLKRSLPYCWHLLICRVPSRSQDTTTWYRSRKIPSKIKKKKGKKRKKSIACLDTAPVVSSGIARDWNWTPNGDIHNMYFAKCQLQAPRLGCVHVSVREKDTPSASTSSLSLSRSTTAFANVECTALIKIAAASRCRSVSCVRTCRSWIFFFFFFKCCFHTQTLKRFVTVDLWRDFFSSLCEMVANVD